MNSYSNDCAEPNQLAYTSNYPIMYTGFGRQGAQVSSADGEESRADRGREHAGAAGGGHVGAVAGNGAGNA